VCRHEKAPTRAAIILPVKSQYTQQATGKSGDDGNLHTARRSVSCIVVGPLGWSMDQVRRRFTELFSPFPSATGHARQVASIDVQVGMIVPTLRGPLLKQGHSMWPSLKAQICALNAPHKFVPGIYSSTPAQICAAWRRRCCRPILPSHLNSLKFTCRVGLG
jgi:hypothetical protein